MRLLVAKPASLFLLAILFLTSGCVKFDVDMKISPRDHIDMTMLLAIQQQYASEMGEICDPSSDAGTFAGGTVEPYEQDGFIGCTITANSVPIAEVLGEDSPLRVVHQDSQYSFSMANTDTDDGSAEMARMMFTTFRVAVTFPGEVTSHSGSSTLEGTTVTWTDPTDWLSGEGLRATSKEPNPLAVALPWAASLLVLVAVIAGVVVLLKRRKSQAAQTEGGE